MRVLVIVARGLHAGYVGCLGNDWIDTPALDRLAAEGVVFDKHYADQPDPAGAARGWRTGRYSFPISPGEMAAAAEEGPDLLALLHRAGVRSVLIGDGGRPDFTVFAAGWNELVRVSPASSAEEVLAAVTERLPAAGPWLLWLDLAALLPPWTLHEPFRDQYFDEEADGSDDEDEPDNRAGPLTPWAGPAGGFIDPQDDAAFIRLQRTYAGAVTGLDEALGRFLEAPERRALLEEVLIVFTTDHGLPLGEHGVLGTVRPWLHDELIHLPLLLRLPGGVEAGRRVPALTQPVDLMPTLLEAFGLPAPRTHGHSLFPLLRGEVEQVRAYAAAGLQAGDRVEWALRTPAWSFLLPLAMVPDDPPRPPQLYVKPDDRWEVNNVVQHHLEVAEHLEQTLRGFVEATRRPGPLEPPLLRDLEAEAAAGPQQSLPGGT